MSSRYMYVKLARIEAFKKIKMETYKTLKYFGLIFAY